jgi:hypothetical protein
MPYSRLLSTLAMMVMPANSPGGYHTSEEIAIAKGNFGARLKKFATFQSESARSGSGLV